MIGLQILSLAGNLHVSLMQRAIRIAQQQRYARHAIAADHADLDWIVPVGDHGGDAAVKEIDTLDAPVAGLQLLANRQVDGFEMRLEESRIGARQARQQLVGHMNAAARARRPGTRGKRPI